MKIRHSPFSSLVAVAIYVLSVGASIAQSDVAKRAPDVRLYKLGELNASRVEVVSRLWADTWRSAFWVPSYPSQEQAIAASQTEAARQGADGLINVVCLDQGRSKWSSTTDPAIVCYGIAIHVRPSEG
jgi:hypothetical protein